MKIYGRWSGLCGDMWGYDAGSETEMTQACKEEEHICRSEDVREANNDRSKYRQSTEVKNQGNRLVGSRAISPFPMVEHGSSVEHLPICSHTCIITIVLALCCSILFYYYCCVLYFCCLYYLMSVLFYLQCFHHNFFHACTPLKSHFFGLVGLSEIISLSIKIGVSDPSQTTLVGLHYVCCYSHLHIHGYGSHDERVPALFTGWRDHFLFS